MTQRCRQQVSKTEGFEKLADAHPHIMADLFADLRSMENVFCVECVL